MELGLERHHGQCLTGITGWMLLGRYFICTGL
jgi:hypothetical protein